LKGSNCDFLHNSQQQRLWYTQPFFHQAQIQPILDPNSYQMLQRYPHPFYHSPFPARVSSINPPTSSGVCTHLH
jgi:hypothetical protein